MPEYNCKAVNHNVEAEDGCFSLSISSSRFRNPRLQKLIYSRDQNEAPDNEGVVLFLNNFDGSVTLNGNEFM